MPFNYTIGLKGLFAGLLLLVGVSISAQDIIYKENGEQINCRILSIDDRNIQFVELQDTAQQLVFHMDISLVESVKFEWKGSSADKMREVQEKDQSQEVELASGSAFKANLDGVFDGFLSLYYEQYWGKHYYDLGVKWQSNSEINTFPQTTVGLELGWGFMFKDFGTVDRPIRALYIRPHFTYTFSRNQAFFLSENVSEFTGGVQLVLKFQLAQRLLLEGYFGLGTSKFSESFELPNRRTDIYGTSGVITTLGLRAAVLF